VLSVKIIKKEGGEKDHYISEHMKNICRFDLDLYENEYELTSEGICDNCGEFSFERVDCPRQFVDFGDKGIGPYFMCEECCDNDFSEEPADCLANGCEIADKRFRSLSDKKSIFIAFLAELNIENYSIEDNIFKFNIGDFESVIISLDKRYERKENLSLLKRNIELFDAHYYRKYCKAFLEKKWFGIEESYVESLRNIGFLVNECDILHSSDIKTPIIRFTSSMGIYGYTPTFFIQEQSLNFVEIYPYNVESIFQKEYRIPYFHKFGRKSSIFKDLEKPLHKNIHYKLIRALGLIQNREKLKINQRIEILHYLSTYFDLAFTELYNKRFGKKVDNANSSLSDLIGIEKIKSKNHKKEKLIKLKGMLTHYNSTSEFEERILALIYSDIIEIKGKKKDLSHLNPHLADLLISILIRNFFAHRAEPTIILRGLNYKYSEIALFSSILSIYYLFIVDDYSIINR